WRATRKEQAIVSERPIERVWVEPERLVLKAGEISPLRLQIKIAKGWHINAAEPQPNLQPTQLSFESKLTVAESVEFPKHKEIKFSFADEPIKVYDGELEITIWLRAKPYAEGEEVLSLRLRYQACDEKRCLMPTETKLQVPVKFES
ncbi:MAG: protein-disulfide reductase DsbD family protein, partial [Archaeoglobaceae archaeon]|nr:protein-disulfide reductase DsbD family protein [Archaeoglobaceae archaeon]